MLLALPLSTIDHRSDYRNRFENSKKFGSFFISETISAIYNSLLEKID